MVEGCVNETFCAQRATFQGQAAADPHVASELASIARDETRHAGQSWQLARWLDARLDAGARQRVARAGRKAVVDLYELVTPADSALRRTVGLPDPAQTRQLIIDQLVEESPSLSAELVETEGIFS